MNYASASDACFFGGRPRRGFAVVSALPSLLLKSIGLSCLDCPGIVSVGRLLFIQVIGVSFLDVMSETLTGSGSSHGLAFSSALKSALCRGVFGYSRIC